MFGLRGVRTSYVKRDWRVSSGRYLACANARVWLLSAHSAGAVAKGTSGALGDTGTNIIHVVRFDAAPGLGGSQVTYVERVWRDSRGRHLVCNESAAGLHWAGRTACQGARL